MYNYKNYAIMKKKFQIVTKGNVTNKIKLYEFNNYFIYKATLDKIRENKFISIITTNMYLEEE